VDDDHDLRALLTGLLQRLGHVVLAAENGQVGLETAERELPDLVISDLSMPVMDGHEMLDQLKKNTRTQHIPVIVVSGEGDADSVVRCIEHGAEDHLTKPYEPVVLQARIRTTLERKRLRDLELAYLGRVAQLTGAAEAVERQTYDSRVLREVMSRPDHLGHLAQVFDRMVTGLRSREEQLQARVRALQQEIEQVAAAPGAATVSEGSPFKVGEVLAGRYEILRELGAGGMGTVYQARDRELGEDVALKILHAGLLTEDPGRIERLKSEIKTARRISHRNVVRSHDLGESDGMHYITMEYIKGVSVADLIGSRGRLTLESTLAIGTQLADALAVAHEARIVHRDIKPQNLMVDEAGVLKVADFGLAQPIQHPGQAKAGFAVGTLSYMPPEQLLGSDVDERADLFAAGVVLYECLSGRRPFEASSPMGVYARMINGTTAQLKALSGDLPPALIALIEKLLEPDPERRLRSARELGEQLAQLSRVTA